MFYKKPLMALSAVMLVSGCVKLGDIENDVVLPDPSYNYPDFIIHDADPISLANPTGYTNLVEDQDVAEGATPEPEQPYVLRRYRIGPPDYEAAVRERGGQTIILEGTGDPVCVIVDPEATRGDECEYDDGDVDLFIGLEEHYQGIPGEKMGFFSSSWTDDLGVEHETDTNICILQVEATEPLGRAVPETCAFNTEPGQRYVIALQAFTYPIDDYVLNIGVLVQPGHRGEPICVTATPRYLVRSTEDIDESDAAFPDNPYAENRDPCFCPKNDTEREECGR